MSATALPCIVCLKVLRNVWPDADNQPSQATAFDSGGHYGSTFFDPMDGQRIEVNICDSCLTERQHLVAWRRQYKLIECEGVIVGRETLNRSSVPYTGEDTTGPDDILQVEVDELGTTLSDRVIWSPAACDLARQVAAHRASLEGSA